MDLIIRNIDPKVIYSIDKMIEQYNHVDCKIKLNTLEK